MGPMYTSTLRGRIVWIRIVVSWWLVWRSGNSVSHINKVKLHRARLVLGLVTTVVSDLPSPYFILAHSTSLVGRCSEYWRVTVLATAGEKRQVLRISGLCYQHCWHVLYAVVILARSKVKGDEHGLYVNLTFVFLGNC